MTTAGAKMYVSYQRMAAECWLTHTIVETALPMPVLLTDQVQACLGAVADVSMHAHSCTGLTLSKRREKASVALMMGLLCTSAYTVNFDKRMGNQKRLPW